MAQDLIYNIVKGKNTLDPALKKSTTQSAKLTKSMKTTGSSFKGAAVAARAIPVAFAALAIGKGIQVVTREAIELENALIGLSSVANATGNNVNNVKKAAIELSADGMIPLSQTSNALKNLLATGLNGEEAVTVFKKLRDAAAFNRQGQLSLGEAIAGAAEGLKNDLSIKVDNAGITKNLSNINKEYAASIGKTVAQLTDAERVQAKVVGISKEGAIFQGDYNRLLDTFSGQLGRLGGEFKFLLADIGTFIAKNETAKNTIAGLADIVSAIRRVIKGETVGEIFKQTRLEETEEELINIKRAAQNIFKEVERLEQKQKFGVLRDTEIASLKLARAELRELAAERLRLDRVLAEGIRVETKTPKESPEVKLERGKNALIKQLRQERREAEREDLELQLQETAGTDEERLLSLQDQLKKEQEIRNFADLEKSAASAKSQEDLNKIDEKAKIIKQKAVVDDLKADIAAAKTKTAIAKAEQDARLRDQQSFFSVASSLASSESKTLAAIGKAAAITQIAIKTPEAVASSFAFGASIGGPPLGFALGAIAGTAMAAQAARVAGIKGFQNGGITDGTLTGDQGLARTNKNEVILNGQQQAQTLFEIANGRSTDNNQVQDTADIVVQVDGREIARVVRDQIKQGFRVA